MENLKKVGFVIFTMLLGIYAVQAQKDIDKGNETIKGFFDNFDEENFTFIYLNGHNKEDTISFPRITPEILKKYNLSNNKYVGKTFNIIFNSEIEIEIEEDGDEQEYIIRTIIGLELLEQ